jgi:hypothetical protein
MIISGDVWKFTNALINDKIYIRHIIMIFIGIP